mgnify:CR=1 FL=1
MLSAYLNLYNTCLVILKRRGFELRCEMPGENWLAMKDGFSFRADNPIELLGVVGIYEEIKPATDSEYWWRLDQPDLLTELSPS